MIEAKGSNGTIRFDGAMVTLIRGGGGRLLVGKGTKSVPIGHVVAVQWKVADWMAPGFLSLTIAGGNEVRSAPGMQALTAMHDENSITFHGRQQAQMQVVREAIEEAIAGPRAPATPQDTAARLAQLATLLADRAITPAEYDTARQRILADL